MNMLRNTEFEEVNTMNTFYGIDIQKFTTEEINEIAEIARMRGHVINSREDLAKIDLEEQGLIYDVWVGGCC